jgi:hypothetical protein
MRRAHAALLLALALAPRCPADHPPPCPADHPPPLVEKKGCVSQILLVPHEKAVVLPNWKLRDVEVDRHPSLKLEFVEQKQIIIENKLQECEVEQPVTVTESKAITVVDPCGKCRTEYVPCEVVKIVKVKVYKVVPVPREVVISVPVLKPGPDVVVSKVHLDKLTTPGIETRFTAVPTYNEVKTLVPAPVIPKCPAPPAPCHE